MKPLQSRLNQEKSGKNVFFREKGYCLGKSVMTLADWHGVDAGLKPLRLTRAWKDDT